jgi:UDP-arabinose 4-epimerase
MAHAYVITSTSVTFVDAHVKAMINAKPQQVGIYNVGAGKGSSVKEFVDACKAVTGVNIIVKYLDWRPGD